jgi:hypothetical protein
MVEKELTPLPTWIVRTKTGYSVPLEMAPLHCTNCGATWYPRIKPDGTIIIPKACAANECRTGAWRKIRR